MSYINFFGVEFTGWLQCRLLPRLTPQPRLTKKEDRHVRKSNEVRNCYLGDITQAIQHIPSHKHKCSTGHSGIITQVVLLCLLLRYFPTAVVVSVSQSSRMNSQGKVSCIKLNRFCGITPRQCNKLL